MRRALLTEFVFAWKIRNLKIAYSNCKFDELSFGICCRKKFGRICQSIRFENFTIVSPGKKKCLPAESIAEKQPKIKEQFVDLRAELIFEKRKTAHNSGYSPCQRGTPAANSLQADARLEFAVTSDSPALAASKKTKTQLNFNKLDGMPNVTLISTEHMEFGNCNSDELFKIVESIKPEVIFEEEPNDDKYHSYYNDGNSFKSLEIRAIIKYKLNHDIIHLPVDKPINEFVSLHALDLLTKKFSQYHDYKQIIKKHCSLRDNYGFDYLNSEKCSELFEKMKLIQKQILSNNGLEINNLDHFYNLFQQEVDARENAMLQNIYNFSNSNKFEQAVFFLGYAHRESIEKKISERELKKGIKINWTFYKGIEK